MCHNSHCEEQSDEAISDGIASPSARNDKMSFMNMIRRKKHNVWVRMVTVVLITSFLCQNIASEARAGNNKENCLASRSLFKLFEKKGRTLREALDTEDRLFALHKMILRGDLKKNELRRRDMDAANSEFIDKIRFSYSVRKEDDYRNVFLMDGNLYEDEYGDTQTVVFYPENDVPWDLLEKKYGLERGIEDEDYARRGFWIASKKIPPYSYLIQEHVEYCLELRKVFNPDNKPMKGIYGFAGPDLSTFLLSTNAIEGLFLDPLTRDNFKDWRDKWGMVDIPSNNDEQRIFNARRDEGYWDTASIQYFGLWRLIFFELKMLGVDKESIDIEIEANKVIKIEFIWKHPVEKNEKKRIIRFGPGIYTSELASFFEDLSKNKDFIPYDLYYSKGALGYTSERMNNFYAYLYEHRIISSNSSFMIGVTFTESKAVGSKPYNTQLEETKRAFPEHEYIEIGNQDIIGRLLAIMPEQYGWRIMVFIPLKRGAIMQGGPKGKKEDAVLYEYARREDTNAKNLVEYLKRTELYVQIGIIIEALSGDITKLARFNCLLSESFERLAAGDRERAIKEYLSANLGWFIGVFESYKEDGILSQQGLLLLQKATEMQSGVPQDELYEDLFHVISYFRSIADMTGDMVKEKFPQEYFKKIKKLNIRGRSDRFLKLIDGCNSGCVFCYVQDYSKKKVMPYPLAVMIAKAPDYLVSLSTYYYEPLSYEDKCGALYYDVEKLFNHSGCLTHGYTEGEKDIALRNIRRIKQHIKSEKEKYRVGISIHVADVDYSRLKKDKKTDDEILEYYVRRYLFLIKELDGCEINLRFQYPPQACSGERISEWKRMMDELKRRVIDELSKERNVYDFDFEGMEAEDQEAVYYKPSNMLVFLHRGDRYVDEKQKRKVWEQAIDQNDFFAKRHTYYIDSYGMLNILLGPIYQFSRVLFKKPSSFDKKYIADRILLDASYRSLLHDIVSLTKSAIPAEMDNLLNLIQNHENGKVSAKRCAQMVLKYDLPVPIGPEHIDRMLELGRIPEHRPIPLTSIYEDGLPAEYTGSAVNLKPRAGKDAGKKGLLDEADGEHDALLELLSAV